MEHDNQAGPGDESPPDDLEDGPIILEPGDCCAKCHYSKLVQLQNQIRRVRICQRFPPIPLMVPVQGPNGVAMTLTTQNPLVDDSHVCFEFDERENPEVIPTGLIT